jgi:hypothetical protein
MILPLQTDFLDEANAYNLLDKKGSWGYHRTLSNTDEGFNYNDFAYNINRHDIT